MTTAIEYFGPGPLPVIKAICEDLGILDTLNEQLTWDETLCNLSPAHRLLALIINVLTEGQPMYRLPEFFEGTDVENLFGEDVDPEDINNHACARALDKPYEAEPSTVLLSGFSFRFTVELSSNPHLSSTEAYITFYFGFFINVYL